MNTRIAPVDIQDPLKRSAILEAATMVFAQRGFENTDVQDVADAAGVGKGTVYRYFGNKCELFRATADNGMRQLESHFLVAIDGVTDPVEMMHRGAAAYAEFFEQHPQLVEILILERAEFRGTIPDTHMVYRAKNRGIMEDALRQGIADGLFRPLDVTATTTAFANMLYGTVVCGCLEGSTASLRPLSEHAVGIFVNGILARPTSNSC
jgi:AcrR family transcriptional regulator